MRGFDLARTLINLALMIAGMVLVIRSPRAKGKDLMLVFLAVSLLHSLGWMIAGFMAVRFGTRFFDLFRVVQGIADIATWGLLIGFLAIWRSQLKASNNREAAAANPAAAPLQQPGAQMTMSKVLFSFTGRIGRATFWAIWILMFVANALLSVMIQAVAQNEPAWGLLALAWLPFAVWISLAMQVKRWHDRGKSGWMVLINFIPIVGLIWALVELGFLKGTAGSNQYGEDPVAS